MRASSVKVDSVTRESFTSSGHRLVSVVAFRKRAIILSYPYYQVTVIPSLARRSHKSPFIWDYPERSDKDLWTGSQSKADIQ